MRKLLAGTSKILGLSNFGRERPAPAADFALLRFAASVSTLWLLEVCLEAECASSEFIDCDAADSVSDSDSVESNQLSSTSGSATETG